MTPEQAIQFAQILKKEYFDKLEKEYCSNAGDPGEACDCCPVLDKFGNPIEENEES